MRITTYRCYSFNYFVSTRECFSYNFSLFYFIHDFCFKVRGSVTVTMMNPKEKFIDPLST